MQVPAHETKGRGGKVRNKVVHAVPDLKDTAVPTYPNFIGNLLHQYRLENAAVTSSANWKKTSKPLKIKNTFLLSIH